MAKNNPRVIGLDGDTKNSTFADKIKAVDPVRFIEGYIAEQNIVGVAIGAACRDRTVAFVSAFAAFFSRAYDQVYFISSIFLALVTFIVRFVVNTPKYRIKSSRVT